MTGSTGTLKQDVLQTMFSFDWHRFLLNDQPATFLFEVVVRVMIAYLVVFTFLKVSGPTR